jgi:hypothetical protein
VGHDSRTQQHDKVAEHNHEAQQQGMTVGHTSNAHMLQGTTQKGVQKHTRRLL